MTQLVRAGSLANTTTSALPVLRATNSLADATPTVASVAANGGRLIDVTPRAVNSAGSVMTPAVAQSVAVQGIRNNNTVLGYMKANPGKSVAGLAGLGASSAIVYDQLNDVAADSGVEQAIRDVAGKALEKANAIRGAQRDVEERTTTQDIIEGIGNHMANMVGGDDMIGDAPANHLYDAYQVVESAKDDMKTVLRSLGGKRAFMALMRTLGRDADVIEIALAEVD